MAYWGVWPHRPGVRSLIQGAPAQTERVLHRVGTLLLPTSSFEPSSTVFGTRLNGDRELQSCRPGMGPYSENKGATLVSEPENSAAMKYVQSFNDDSKRHFAIDYWAWIRNGREGEMPDQGPLSLMTVRLIARTLDRLALRPHRTT